MVQDKSFVDWDSCCRAVPYFSHESAEYFEKYIVLPIENSDSTELFITRTD